MKVAFDTSVIVAALVKSHPHHQRAHLWLQAALGGSFEATATWHAMAESWAVLTRLPLRPTLSGEQAVAILERFQRQKHFTVVELSGDIYSAAFRRCAAVELSSGAVFDAIHLVAAEMSGADLMLTFNVEHFQRLATKDSPRIVAPPNPPSLSTD